MQNQDETELELESAMESQDDTDNAVYTEEDDSLKTTSLTIKGHLLKWDNYVVQISNISLVSSGEKEPPHFPIWILWVTIVGFIVLAYGINRSGKTYGHDEMAGAGIGVGILLLIVALIAVIIWFCRVSEATDERYLHIHMNSGNTYSILFKDREFLEKRVMPMFSKIFQDGAKGNMSFHIDIRNCNIEDSSIGNTVKGK